MIRITLLLPLLLSGCDLPQQPSHTVLPEPDSAGAMVMKKFCSDCHAPPSPAAHVAEEWSNVLYRMQERRRMKAYEIMNAQEEKILLDYLQQYAKAG